MAISCILGPDGILRIILNRPERLNAFDSDLAAEFAAAAERISEQEVRVVLLSAEGPAFCAGGDVVAMAATESGSVITELAQVINRGLSALLSSSVPVVAAAHGTTAGGGLGLLLASDYAIVGESSRIGALYATQGLTPDLSVTALLGDAVGQRRALQLTLNDQLLTAQQALEWGLVAEVVPDGAVKSRADEFATALANGAYAAYGQAKRLLRARPDRALAEHLEDEARTIGAAFDTPEASARIAAFAARARSR
ncbi:Enoyl-CoA hydratase [Ruaniaceae bacterium KH17]|nr:Enoyl-CoA hydratase [Ruaniaceae bacterium KH17]